MSALDQDIADVEVTLRHLKKLRGAERHRAAWADPAVRAKMSAARKAAWAIKEECDGAPKQSRVRASASEIPRLPSLAEMLA